MDPLLKQWREETPGCANHIHLNNASAGLMPRSVLDAIVGHLNREANFGAYESADDAEAAVSEAYANVSKLLGTQPRNVAVVENSTVAFFQALAAFDFKPGDVIVTTRMTISPISSRIFRWHGAMEWKCAAPPTLPAEALIRSRCRTCFATRACDCSRLLGCPRTLVSCSRWKRWEE